MLASLCRFKCLIVPIILLPACQMQEKGEKSDSEHEKIVVTSPLVRDTTLCRKYGNRSQVMRLYLNN